MSLWLEEVTLPAQGSSRTDADIARLQHRLDEAQQAALNGNAGAVSAALAAYRETVDDAISAAATKVEWLARIEAALGNHLAVLRALAGMVPAQALDAIQQAIVKSSQAQDRIGGPNGPSGPTIVPGGPTTGPGGPEPAGPQETAKTPEPDPAPNTDPTPKPDPTPDVDVTPGPGRTPPPVAPPASPGRAGGGEQSGGQTDDQD